MLAIMRRYKFVPEAYNLNTQKVEKGLGQYPLRPEVAESLFYLHQATGKEEYREAGRLMVKTLYYLHFTHQRTHTQFQVSNLNTHARTQCGFAAVENVAPSKKPLRDHMDSYFLAETLKCARLATCALLQRRVTHSRYLFLLLDEGETSAPYRNLSNFVCAPVISRALSYFSLLAPPQFQHRGTPFAAVHSPTPEVHSPPFPLRRLVSSGPTPNLPRLQRTRPRQLGAVRHHGHAGGAARGVLYVLPVEVW